MTTRCSLWWSLLKSLPFLVRTALGTFAALMLVTSALVVAFPMAAGTIVVSTTADNPITPITGSLRWAIGEANLSTTSTGPCTQPCTIQFNAGGEGLHTITSTALPIISVPGVTIDGYSSPNSVPNSSAFPAAMNAQPKVVIRGSGGAQGLRSQAGQTTIRGLVIQNFNDGISLSAYATDAVIAGNFIGTDETGTTAFGNFDGINVAPFQPGTVRIGGPNAADRNLISGNVGHGVMVFNSSSAVQVEGNFIGVRADGTAALANTTNGVWLFNSAAASQVGLATGNVISGNGAHGIAIDGTSGTSIDSNRIGTNAAGTGAIPNVSGGILNNALSHDTLIGYGGSGNLIVGGGTGIGIDIVGSNEVRAAKNTIRSHAIGVGVTLAAVGNEIRDNAISANGIGIDLGKDGVTANDATDPDSGPNNFQNFPTIDSAVAIDGLPGEVRVSIDSSSSLNASLVIEVFKADASANAQGLQSIATLCTGNSPLSNQPIAIPAGLLAPGDRVVATATGYFDVCDLLPSSDGTSEFSPAVAAVAGVGSSDLSVTKTDGVASVAAGSTVTYTLVVTNAGPSATTGATLTDTLPVTLTGATWTCTAGAGAVCGAPAGAGNINTTLNLAASASATYVVTATLSPTATGSLVNTATVAPGSDATDPAPTNNTGTDVDSITQQTDLAITKTDGVTSVTAGSTVTYTIVVTNNGPSSVTGATVADTLPGTLSGATWSCVASGGSCTASGSGNINDTVSLSPAGTATYTLTATLAASATGTLSNTATVTAPVAAAATDPNLANNSATDSDAIAASADLAITKTDGVASVNAGTAVNYTIVVTNNGPSNISGASITDTFPVSVTGVTWTCSASAGSACGAASGSGNLATSGDLLVGGTTTFLVTGTLSAASSGTLTNTATVAVPAGSTDPVATNNSATDTDSIVPQADVSVTKSAFSPVIAGTTVTYTITVSNAGPAAANGVSVVENLILAAGLRGPSVEKRGGVRPLLAGATWTCSATTGSSCAAASGTGDINTTVNLLAGGVATFNVAAPLATTASGTLSSTTTVTVPPSVYDPTPGNNVSSVSAAIIQQASLSITKTNNTTAVEPLLSSTYTITVSNAGPSNAPGVLVSDNLPAELTGATWTCTASAGSTCPAGGSGNINTSVDLLAGGSATFNLTATVSGSSGSVSNTATLAPPTGVSDPSSADNSATDTDTIIQCPTEPQPLSTTPNASHTQVTFVWSDVAAPLYELWYSIDGGGFNSAGTTTTTQLVVNISPATETIAWYVVAVQGSCVINGPTSTVTIVEPQTCDAPDTPLAAVIGSVNSGQQYTFFWFTEDFGVRFEYAESNGPDLTGAIWVPTTSRTATFVHDNTSSVSVQYCYAVRAFRDCPDGAKQSEISEPVCVSVLPADTPHGDMVLEEGDTDLVSQILRLCSDENEHVYDCSNSDFDQKFAAVIAPHSGPTVSLGSDRTWMSVNPPSTTVPPTGTNVTVTVNPGSLPTGTNTGSVVATSTTTGQTSNVPFSVNVVTPVSPQGKTVPPANALLIPAVAHVEGINSRWQSDIRMSNTSLQKVAYDLTFTPSGQNGAAVGKKTRLELKSGETKALDDIVKHWYGLGTLQNGSNGVLEIRPVNFNGKTEDASLGYATVASSRTYNDTVKGTYGQWIPAVPFANFIGRGPSGVSPILSMQQIAQSSRYRTNLGVVEGAGQPVTVQFTVFNSAGTKLTDFTVALKAMEHQQLNGILASKNLTVTDGRIEAKVVQGDGRITTYASVVDAGTNDPLLVPGVVAADKRGTRFVLPGIADLDTGRNHWRSDTRIFNPGTTPVEATAIFYEQNDPSKTKSATITVGAGQVLVIDDTLRTLFGSQNVGGAIHIVTPSETALVATSRTYDQQSTGTFGQFIEAFTAADAVGVADRSLQILQIEQSDRYRTNLGLAEVTGSEATVEITALIPESTVAPKLRLVLKPNEFTQLNGVLKQMGVGTAYNVRLSVKVVGGGGRVSAYGSVIDQSTQDPTYVPAQ